MSNPLPFCFDLMPTSSGIIISCLVGVLNREINELIGNYAQKAIRSYLN